MAPWESGPGVVEFPDARRVRGASRRRGRGDAAVPDLAIHLSGERPPATSWEQVWIRWPDFWLPRSTDEAIRVLAAAHGRAVHERIEIACGGGVGRTGTAIAFLATLSGVDPAAAVDWVRQEYHPRAVETPWQRRWIRRAHRRWRSGAGPG